MKKLITWLAEDGTQFGTEEQCIKYENQSKELEEKVIFIADGEIMKNESLDYKLRECEFVVIRDIRGAKLLNDALREDWLDSPFHYEYEYRTGIFEYNEDGIWKCIDEELATLQEKKNKILELLREEQGG